MDKGRHTRADEIMMFVFKGCDEDPGVSLRLILHSEGDSKGFTRNIHDAMKKRLRSACRQLAAEIHSDMRSQAMREGM